MTAEHEPQSLRCKTKIPAPLDGEELIFSVSCRSSHLRWATHRGNVDDYSPQMYWRTSHLEEGETDLLAVLSRSLPDAPHEFVFGTAADATAANARAQAKRRIASRVSVYVVSTNLPQERLLAAVWGAVPSRCFVLRGDDFFKREVGRYDGMGMGTDRLATLAGAVHLHGHPALVFDGGTATTYSATDRNGKIMGGGIGPGIRGCLAAVAAAAGADGAAEAAGDASAERVLARIKEANEKGRPGPAFARNSPEAALADGFQEFALKGRNVVEHWLKKAYHKPLVGTPAALNAGKRVVCTGEEGEVLTKLLHPHYGGVIGHAEETRSRYGAVGPRYIVEEHEHLTHHGIAAVLAAAAAQRPSEEEFCQRPHEGHVGRRVAKQCGAGAADGDRILRGTVTKIAGARDGDAAVCIQYDGGDREDVPMSGLYDMCQLFAVHGEKEPPGAAPPKGKARPAPTATKEVTAPDSERTAAAPRLPAVAPPSVSAVAAPRLPAVVVPSVPAKSTKNAARGAAQKATREAPLEEAKTEALTSALASPGDEEMTRVAGVPATTDQTTAIGAPPEGKKAEAKNNGKLTEAGKASKQKTVNGAPPEVKKAEAKNNGKLMEAGKASKQKTAKGAPPEGNKAEAKNNGERVEAGKASKQQTAKGTPPEGEKAEAKNNGERMEAGKASKQKAANGAPPKEKKAEAQNNGERMEAGKASKLSSGREQPAKDAANGPAQNEETEKAEEEKTKEAKKAKAPAAEKAATTPRTPARPAATTPRSPGRTARRHTPGSLGSAPARSSKRLSPARSSKRHAGSSARSSKRKAEDASPPEQRPAAKKSRSIEGAVNFLDPRTFVRRRVAKDFDGDLYFGSVRKYDDAESPAYWHVEYDDGDEEDYSKRDLVKALKYYEVTGKKDRKK